MRRAFTLIELLTVVAIMATMVTVGVVSLSSSRGSTRVFAAVRDMMAMIRRARSVALVTQKPALVIYSNAIDAYLEKVDNFAIDESFWGRIFRYSTITIGTASTTLKFPYMQNAVEFKNKVMDCYDARKTSLMMEQAVLINAREDAASNPEAQQ